ncbi:hypothetical protein QVD17_14967 [Tagetes erecta]|uniref:Uncharacterized protein n=1 Tax=Tagetes erecta TaxID=13708 RepID=A0AAD8KSB2_TARER|nr:hypothetical protein QVD17_14967 [Tagetes erecta]
MRDQDTDRGRMVSLVDLPLNESWSSQRSGLGSGIPSQVGAFGWKVTFHDSSESVTDGNGVGLGPLK